MKRFVKLRLKYRADWKVIKRPIIAERDPAQGRRKKKTED